MELNATIALDKELHFCETGNRLALEYLKISRDVGVPGSICASGGETNWNKRSGRWREARSIVQNRL